MLEIEIFGTQKLTINSINYQYCLIKLCIIIDKLYDIICHKYCLNWLRYSYFIMKCVWLQFFLRHTVFCQP